MATSSSPWARTNWAQGFSPGLRYLIWLPLLVSMAMNSMWCSSSMGCSTEPTWTDTRPPSTVTAGTCFSAAPSLVPGTSSVIFCPQHITGTPEAWTKVMMLPQWSQR